MPDSKHMRWDQDFGTDAEQEPKESPLAANVPAANDADGWQQYRRWINKAPAPKTRRSGIDPALYSWKGYRDWTDQVRRNWAKEAKENQD
jgi:hypothetical protein